MNHNNRSFNAAMAASGGRCGSNSACAVGPVPYSRSKKERSSSLLRGSSSVCGGLGWVWVWVWV